VVAGERFGFGTGRRGAWTRTAGGPPVSTAGRRSSGVAARGDGARFEVGIELSVV